MPVVKVLGPDDVALVCAAVQGVFDHAPQKSLTAEFLNDPRHHLVAALEEGKVIGFISAVHYVHPDKPAELWINEVAVAPVYQRIGIGKEMMQAMLSLGRELNCNCAWVLTDAPNTAAMRLYAASGGTPTPCVMFEFTLKTG